MTYYWGRQTFPKRRTAMDEKNAIKAITILAVGFGCTILLGFVFSSLVMKYGFN